MERLGLERLASGGVAARVHVWEKTTQLGRSLPWGLPRGRLWVPGPVWLWLDKRDLRGDLQVDQHLRPAFYLYVEGGLLCRQHLAEVRPVLLP